MTLIHVGLYGDGSCNARLRAEYIRCDSANECSAYKNGKCFCVTTLFGTRCGVGTVSVLDGGLKRSKAYASVWNDAKSNECYGKLSYPGNVYVTQIGSKMLLAMPYVKLTEAPSGHIVCDDPGFGAKPLLIDADRLTPENIKRICNYTPHAIIGGAIEAYKSKTIPMFLHQLSVLFPELFSAFVAAYPEFEIKPPDWVGRYAKLILAIARKNTRIAMGMYFTLRTTILYVQNIIFHLHHLERKKPKCV